MPDSLTPFGRTLDEIIFSALCLTLFLIPLPFGSVEAWSVYAFEAVTLILFALSAAADLLGLRRTAPEPALEARSDRPVSLAWKLLLGVFFLTVALQIAPLPPALVKALSPKAFGIAALGGQAVQPVLPGAGPRALTLSLAPALTAYELLKYLCYLLFAGLVYRHARTRRRVEILVVALLAAGLFQAVYGLLQLWGGTGRIFGWKNRWNQGSAFGTFVNRNHFAGFLEMVFPLSVGYLLAKARPLAGKPGLALKEKILRLGQERLQKTILLGMLAAVLGLGLVFSRSRAGLLIFLITLILMSTATSLTGFRPGRSRTAAPDGARSSGPRRDHSGRLVRTVTLAVAASALLIGLNPVLSRFTSENVTRNRGRAVFFKNTLDLTAMFAWTGSGAGTFVHAYPLAEKADEAGLLTHAHNDYLETLAETGVPAGGALILAGFGLWIGIFARWAKRRDSFVRGIGLGALMGLTALLIHSGLDFNLRIPANAVVFISLYALALRTVRLPSRP